MHAGDENLYAAPNAVELLAATDVPLEHPGLPKFLLQGLYAALLTAPFSAAYFGVIHIAGLDFALSLLGRVGYSIVGIAIDAFGDGLTAMLCWKIVKNEPRSLTLFATGMGTGILAILCQGVVATGLHWNFSALPRFILFGLIYGLPSLFLTFAFLRLLNRRVLFWVYPTVFVAASIGAYMLGLTMGVIAEELFATRMSWIRVLCSKLAVDGLILCVLAALLWFGVKVSQPTLTPTSTNP